MVMITKYLKMMMAIGCIALAAASCEIEEIDDPNNPSRSGIEENATVGGLNNLVAGTESLMRSEIGFYYDAVGIIGREYYFFTDADPRYTGELLGKGESTLDNAGFYGTRPYAGRYQVILNSNILITAVNNTTADLTTEEKNGYIGFAKTAQAYSYLLALNLQYENGIRIDVSDPDNLGDFVSYTEGLTAISGLLDEAYTLLENSGTAFRFNLSSGFDGFDTPETFASFNRAIKARVELYRGNNAAALTALDESFMDLVLDEQGDLDIGPLHFYSQAGNDVLNPVYRSPGDAEALIVHPSFLSDAADNDARVLEKTLARTVATLDGLSGDHDVILYESTASGIPIIRNEELILIYAEANIGIDNTEAVNAINLIRNAHGIGDYGGATTNEALIDEILFNRRYSLFGEGHRWIDLRRYDRLDELPIDREGDDVWVQFPRPVSETGL
jgi:starch-binding outer membrane protein, SusD/RagB family